MPIEPWKQGKEIFNGQRFNNRLRYLLLFSFIWCNPQHYEGLKPSRYTGIINKNQIYIIMESQYKVCEVKLTYKSKIKASEREKILSAENAYKILMGAYDNRNKENMQNNEAFYSNQSFKINSEINSETISGVRIYYADSAAFKDALKSYTPTPASYNNSPFFKLQSSGGGAVNNTDGFAYYTYGPNKSIKEFTYVNTTHVYRSYDGGSTWYDITPPQSSKP